MGVSSFKSVSGVLVMESLALKSLSWNRTRKAKYVSGSKMELPWLGHFKWSFFRPSSLSMDKHGAAILKSLRDLGDQELLKSTLAPNPRGCL